MQFQKNKQIVLSRGNIEQKMRPFKPRTLPSRYWKLTPENHKKKAICPPVDWSPNFENVGDEDEAHLKMDMWIDCKKKSMSQNDEAFVYPHQPIPK